MYKYEKDLFGKDWKITVDTFAFQAIKTKIELRIGNTLIKTRVFDINSTQANAINSFISMTENDLYKEAKTILNSYRIFYYIIRYRNFAEIFFNLILI